MPGESSSGKILSQGVVAGRLANKGSPPPVPANATRSPPTRQTPSSPPPAKSRLPERSQFAAVPPVWGAHHWAAAGRRQRAGSVAGGRGTWQYADDGRAGGNNAPPPPMVYPPNGREGVPWSWTTLPAGGALPFGRCYYSGHHMPFPPSSFLVNES